MAEQFTDRDLQCVDCGNNFTFTSGEQAFFQQKGFTDPKRCGQCRAAKKQSAQAGGNRNDRR